MSRHAVAVRLAKRCQRDMRAIADIGKHGARHGTVVCAGIVFMV
jgi:hypothetical protein